LVSTSGGGITQVYTLPTGGIHRPQVSMTGAPPSNTVQQVENNNNNNYSPFSKRKSMMNQAMQAAMHKSANSLAGLV
jgi:hypothetical protein